MVSEDVPELGQAGVLLEALAKPDRALVSDLVVVQAAKRRKVDDIKNTRKIRVAHGGRHIQAGVREDTHES